MLEFPHKPLDTIAFHYGLREQPAILFNIPFINMCNVI